MTDLPERIPPKRRIIVGLTGASGAILGVRLLEELVHRAVETHLVVTRAGEQTLRIETGRDLAELQTLAHAFHAIDNLAAPISSGSFSTDGMVVAPCSVNTLSCVASGVTTNLLTRAADVTLKERRPLILVVRETPLHTGHLRSMTAASEIGAIILPPVPAFYSRPRSIEDVVDQVVGRALRLLGFETDLVSPWQGG